MARSFNGTTDLIAAGGVANATLQPNTFTVAGWANPSNLTATPDYHPFIANYDVNGHGYGLFLRNSGKVACYMNTISIDPGSTTINVGTWYHIAAVFIASTSLVSYVNGVNQGASTGPATAAYGNSTFKFGTDDTANNRFLFGSAADGALWNTNLTAGEILALANGARPYTIRSGSLVGYWPLTGLQSPEPDLSGNANNGTLTGTANASGPPIMPFTPRWGRFVGWTPMLPASGLGWIINRRNKLMVPKKRA